MIATPLVNIFLVRHGESEGNIDPQRYKTVPDFAIPLTQNGHEQSNQSSKFLREYLEKFVPHRNVPHFKHECRLWVSPYVRSRETALHFEKDCEDFIGSRKEHMLLCEQQFGLFDGYTTKEQKDNYPEEYAHFKRCLDFEGRFWARFPLGESQFDVAQRIYQFINTLKHDSQGIRNVIVVAHGIALRIFTMLWMGHPYEWVHTNPLSGNCAIRHIQLESAGIEPKYHDHGFIFKGFNTHSLREWPL